mmetsp:Transcript_46233/g.77065  ORF Transcript_46233/g.77065 Transcript_46233/m.77065 type:complete len:261 (-) Transcript_46233:60-842(-)
MCACVVSALPSGFTNPRKPSFRHPSGKAAQLERDRAHPNYRLKSTGEGRGVEERGADRQRAASTSSFRYPPEEEGLPQFVYERDFLTPQQLQTMQSTLQKYRPKLKKDHSFAIKRKSCMVPVTSAAYALWTGKEMTERLQSLLQPEVLPGDFPMELRLYSIGAAMGWHVDDLMYEEPQYELVFTIDNTSDSFTKFRDHAGTLHSIWAQPNSLLVIRAAGVRHRVTAVGEGERSIIKLLYTTTYNKTQLYSEVIDSAPWRR